MIGILNYGLGNIRAFANIYKRLDISFKIISSKSDFINVTKLILPGVGSFDYAISALNKSGFRSKVEDCVMIDKMPILGVCVGLQLFAESSEEGVKKGLGWIKGDVKKISSVISSKKVKLPHMGWNNIEIVKNNKIVKGIKNNSFYYFLHSFYFDCHDSKNVIAKTNYGIDFPSVLSQNNIYGFQGHPEKSHLCGITILKNFDKI